MKIPAANRKFLKTSFASSSERLTQKEERNITCFVGFSSICKINPYLNKDKKYKKYKLLKDTTPEFENNKMSNMHNMR